MDYGTAYWSGVLFAYAMMGALIAALIGGHLPKQNVIKWAIGGMLLGIAIGVYTMTDRENYDPEVAAKDFYDGCVEGVPKEYAEFGGAYCSCMMEKFRTNEQGFRDLIRNADEQKILAEMLSSNPISVELQLQCGVETGLTPRK